MFKGVTESVIVPIDATLLAMGTIRREFDLSWPNKIEGWTCSFCKPRSLELIPVTKVERVYIPSCFSLYFLTTAEDFMLYDGPREVVDTDTNVRGCDSSPNFDNVVDCRAPLTSTFWNSLELLTNFIFWKGHAFFYPFDLVFLFFLKL